MIDSNTSAGTTSLPSLWGFFARFLLIQAVLFTLEMLRPVQEALIQPFTATLAWISFQLMSLFDGRIQAQGIIIFNQESGFAIEVVAGCNGVEATIILVAGILAFPAPWWYRLKGLALGFLAIHLVNLARIISLFYIGEWNLAIFEWAHLYIWQALILLDAIIVWLIWIRHLPVNKPIRQMDVPA